MTKRPTLIDVSSGYQQNTTLNSNFESIKEAFDNTLSRDGSTPNAMNADLDMNSNDILNINDLDITGTLTVNGTDINDLLAGLGEGEVYAVVNRYSGNGSTVNFTLTVAPVAKANTLVYIDGVYQQKNTYNVSGTTLTFDAAPTVGSSNIEIVTLTAVEGVATDASAVTSDVNGNVQADLDELYSYHDGTDSPTFVDVTATGDVSVSGDIEVSSTAPRVKLTETDGTPTHSSASIVQDSDTFQIQTRTSADVFVSTDYTIAKDSSGATSHRWRIGNNEKARITSTGLGIGTTSPSAALDVVGTAELNGSIKAAGLSTYADNASAISGGLVAGDIYKTATGELRIVV